MLAATVTTTRLRDVTDVELAQLKAGAEAAGNAVIVFRPMTWRLRRRTDVVVVHPS